MTDINELENRLTEVRKQELTENGAVKRLIVSSKERYKVVKIDEVEIRIRPTIPREVRKEIERVMKSDSDIEGSEPQMYSLISAMCLDDPFDKAETWLLIDDKTDGRATEVMMMIYKEALNTEAQIKTFRGV
jgi:hypothetical protein